MTLGPTCNSDIVTNCEAAALDPTVPWIVEDLTLRGGPEADVGLNIPTLSRNLTIRGVRIEGFTVGIQVGAVFDSDRGWVHPRCPMCTVRIEDAELSATPTRSSPGSTATGIGIDMDLRAVELQNVSIETFAGQSSTLHDRREDQLSVSRADGVHVYRNLTRLSASNVSVTDRTGSGGRGLSSLVNTSWIGRNITIQGYQRGIEVNGDRVSLDTIEIDCGFVGLEVAGNRVEVADVVITGCDETGIVARGSYPDFGRGRGVFLEDIRVSNASTAVKILLGRVRVSEFNLTRNRIAVKTDPGGVFAPAETRFANGTITHSAIAGLSTPRRRLTIRNVTFRDNGWQRYADGAALRIEGSDPVTTGDIAVRDSAFKDNAFGIRSPATVDARYNWWGSDRGPRVWAGPGRPPDATGDGDPVSPTVVFTPRTRRAAPLLDQAS